MQGESSLQAVIGKDGRIQNLRVVSGNPLLVKAAWDAVIEWRYRPYLLDGEPVEVEDSNHGELQGVLTDKSLSLC